MSKIMEWEDKVLNRYYQKNGLNALSPEDVRHIFDWFSSSEGQAYHSRILRVAVPTALKLSKQWVANLAKKGIKETEDDVKLTLECADGYSWVELLTPRALEREGTEMKHCVASYKYQLKEDYCRIFSLRDEFNKPHCTLELRGFYVLGNQALTYEVNQISGKANSVLQARYVPFLRDFLNYLHHARKTKVPKNTRYLRHGLIFTENSFIEFSKISKFTGDLNLSYFQGTLPEELLVEGNLLLNHFQGLLPKRLTVTGKLDLSSSTPLNMDCELVVKGELLYSESRFTIPSHWKCEKVTKTTMAVHPQGIIISSRFPNIDMIEPAIDYNNFYQRRQRPMVASLSLAHILSRLHRPPQEPLVVIDSIASRGPLRERRHNQPDVYLTSSIYDSESRVRYTQPITYVSEGLYSLSRIREVLNTKEKEMMEKGIGGDTLIRAQVVQRAEDLISKYNQYTHFGFKESSSISSANLAQKEALNPLKLRPYQRQALHKRY